MVKCIYRYVIDNLSSPVQSKSVTDVVYLFPLPVSIFSPIWFTFLSIFYLHSSKDLGCMYVCLFRSLYKQKLQLHHNSGTNNCGIGSTPPTVKLMVVIGRWTPTWTAGDPKRIFVHSLGDLGVYVLKNVSTFKMHMYRLQERQFTIFSYCSCTMA